MLGAFISRVVELLPHEEYRHTCGKIEALNILEEEVKYLKKGILKIKGFANWKKYIII